jgi:hypothetical protein
MEYDYVLSIDIMPFLFTYRFATSAFFNNADIIISLGTHFRNSAHVFQQDAIRPFCSHVCSQQYEDLLKVRIGN